MSAHNGCNRECANCNLVQDDYELNEMYTDVISFLENKQKNSNGLKGNNKIYICVSNECLGGVVQEHIQIGTAWKKVKPMISKDAIRLVSIADGFWCEIPKDKFKECFRKAVLHGK